VKRGQFTIFIILGVIVLILIVLGGWFFKDQIIDTIGITESVSYPTEIQEVVYFNQECLEDLSRAIVEQIGFQAGKYEPAEEFSYPYNGLLIPYLYIDGEDLSVTKEQTEAAIVIYLSEDIPIECYIKNPNREALNLTLEPELEADVIINNDTVEFSVNFVMRSELGSSSYVIDESYNFIIEAGLGKVSTASKGIVKTLIEDNTVFDWEDMLVYGVDVEVVNMDNYTYVIVLTDKEAFQGEEDYKFIFSSFIYPVEEDETIEDLTLLGVLT
jgi:hypothetical protein